MSCLILGEVYRSITNEIALKFGERTKNMKHQFSASGRRINIFLQTLKANSFIVQQLDRFD